MKRLLPLILIISILLSTCLTGCDFTSDDYLSSAESATETLSDEVLSSAESATEYESSDKDHSSTESVAESESHDENHSSTDTSTEPEESLTDETVNGGCPSSEDHSDKDDNGLCDDCGLSVTIVLDIFAINDLHGKIFDSTSQPGVDEMTTYLKNAYKNEDHVLILSSGDMWQGSSESNLTKGLIVTDWMNELDFVSMTLGNHEFDWGEEYIVNNAKIAEFPFLAINIYDRDTNELAEYCVPSVIVERGGAKIGVIGAIGDCYSSISGEHSDGFYFKIGDELTELVKAESLRLREAGVDFIIYSIHDGYGSSKGGVGNITDSQISAYYNPILSENHVDIVFEGHTHRSYVLVDGDGVYHLQGGGDNSGISYAEATINFANGNCSVQNARHIFASEYGGSNDDPIVNELAKKYEDQLSDASRTLGTNVKYRNKDELRQIMSELYLKAGLETFGDDYDIVLGGGFFSVRSPGHLSAGQVTLSQIQMLFPFENTLVLCSIKGSDLLKRFINTTNTNYFMSYSDYGNSVKNKIDPNQTYYVIVDTYSSTYAPNKLTEVKRYTDGIYSYHLLADYIEAGGLEK